MSRLMPLLTLGVAALFLASLLIGPAPVGVLDSLSALILDDGTPMTLVMREIRLPRALLAVIVGASLGIAGAAMQGYLRNPLAEPGLIGVSASAALGAVIALQTGLAAAFTLALPLTALGTALLGVLLLLTLAAPRGASLTLILAGIAISALAGALLSLVLNLSPNPFATSEIVFWMMGGIAIEPYRALVLVSVLVAVPTVVLVRESHALNLLALGDDTARTLGIEMDYDAAREIVYGMPYGEWKAKYQTEATAEQLEKFEATKGRHAF